MLQYIGLSFFNLKMSRPSFAPRGRPTGNRPNAFNGPPGEVIPVGEVLHEAEGQLVCKVLGTKVHYFNGRIFLDNKAQIGQVDEILGPINGFLFSVKMFPGMVASSLKAGTQVYIDVQQLLPLDRFLPKPPIKKSAKNGFKQPGNPRGNFGPQKRGPPFQSRGPPRGFQSRPSGPGGFQGRPGGFQGGAPSFQNRN